MQMNVKFAEKAFICVLTQRPVYQHAPKAITRTRVPERVNFAILTVIHVWAQGTLSVQNAKKARFTSKENVGQNVREDFFPIYPSLNVCHALKDVGHAWLMIRARFVTKIGL